MSLFVLRLGVALRRLGALALRRLGHGRRGRLVRLRVLFLQLLVGGRLSFRLGVRLLEAGALGAERHPQLSQKDVRLLVRLRARRDRHVEAAHLVDRVVVDLREDDLLADAHRAVAAAVERARVEAAEVADARDRDRGEPVEELVHARAPERDRDADWHAVAQLERCDRLARAADVRRLPGDCGELLRRGVEHVRVLLRVAHAHVERDLLDARDLHRGLVAEALLEGGSDLPLVALPQARRDLCRCRGFHLLDLLAGLLGHTDALAPLALDPDAARLARRGVDQHHVRDVDRALHLNDPAELLGALSVAQRARLDVALDDVDALDVDALALPVDALDAAGPAAVLTGDDADGVVAADL